MTMSLTRRQALLRLGQFSYCVGGSLILTGCVGESFTPLTMVSNSGKDAISANQAQLQSSNGEEAEVLRLVNAFRLRQGRSALMRSSTLSQLADAQAFRMAQTGKVDHAIGFGNSFSKRMDRSSYRAAEAAENLAGGYNSAADAVQGWETSPGHRRNLLKQGVTEMGLGIAANPTARLGTYWALILAAPFRG